MNNKKLYFFVASVFALLSSQAFACSSCGCTLNSDWSAQGLSVGEGTRFDIRYDFFKQSDYRHGSDSVSRREVNERGEEVQDKTINRNLLIGIDQSLNHAWAINLQLPVYNRSHTTYEDYDARELMSSSSKGIGDLRVTARYQGLQDDHTLGLVFGLKLPTGETNDKFKNSDEKVDRGLQLGTGTTDLILGVHKFGSLNRDFDYFVHATVQVPLNSHDQFKPSSGLNTSVGLRYMGFENIIPQLQLNSRIETRESGAQSDRNNSGANLLYLSPGLTVPVSKSMQAYGFFQVPLYQRVNGYQIEPDIFLSLGMRYHF